MADELRPFITITRRTLRWGEAAVYSAASLAADDRAAGRAWLAVAERNAPRLVSHLELPTPGLVAAAFLADGSPVVAVIVGERPDGCCVTSTEEDLMDAVDGGAAIEIRDARNGSALTRIQRAGVRTASFSRDGRVLVTASTTGPDEELLHIQRRSAERRRRLRRASFEGRR